MLKIPKISLSEIKKTIVEGNLSTVLTRYSDIGLALLVIAIIGIMIVPLPTFLLDLLLTTNITIAVVLLMISLYLPNALALASFPTILLITTLFRLALNVSSTRLILLKADAGHVIEAFGNFVVGGDYVVGFVIFLVLTLIQFMVIAKGAERVSEVAARFTLDALPGKQMSIDADLRAGIIDVEEARRKRDYIGRESQFYGAMDGAMKFVKGDAIAGIVISLINVSAGLVIGVLSRGMTFGAAAKKYTLLTIGDGLVSQVPALVIATAAGIITTRVAAAASTSGEPSSLGKEIGTQILAQPKAIAIAAGMLVGLALIPGLPFIPFMALAALSGGLAWGLTRTKAIKDKEELKAQVMESAEPHKRLAKGQEPPKLPMAVPVILETSPGVTPLVDVSVEGGRFIEELIPQMRDWLFNDLGVVFPGVRVRGDASYLEPNSYLVFVNEVPVAQGFAHRDRMLVAENLEQITLMGIQGLPGRHPATERKALWIAKEDVPRLPPMSAPPMAADEAIAVHLANVLRRQVDQLLGIQDVQNILDLLEQQGFGALVKAVVPRLVSIQKLTDVLRRLLRENISIKNMRAVLEALAEWGAFENDPVYLTEYVRMAMKPYIAFKHTGGKPLLSVFLLDPQIEQAVQRGIQQSASGSSLSLEPRLSAAILQAFRANLGGNKPPASPIVLTQMEVRYFVKRLLEFEFPKVAVLSFQELPADLQIQPVGRITLPQGELAA